MYTDSYYVSGRGYLDFRRLRRIAQLGAWFVIRAKRNTRFYVFFSTCPNSVAVQIWTALCTYLLVAIAKREMALLGSLHQVLQIVSISALEKVPPPEVFKKDHTAEAEQDIPIQLEINGFCSGSRAVSP